MSYRNSRFGMRTTIVGILLIPCPSRNGQAKSICGNWKRLFLNCPHLSYLVCKREMVLMALLTPVNIKNNGFENDFD